MWSSRRNNRLNIEIYSKMFSNYFSNNRRSSVAASPATSPGGLSLTGKSSFELWQKLHPEEEVLLLQKPMEKKRKERNSLIGSTELILIQ
jgi:hypothetical protein